MAEQLPDHVVDGEFEDHEWRAIAAKRERTEAEMRRYAAGPKTHPYGSGGVTAKGKDGVTRHFANAAAKKSFVEPEDDGGPAQHTDSAMQREAAGLTREGPAPEPSPNAKAGPLQAEASKRASDATPKPARGVG